MDSDTGDFDALIDLQGIVDGRYQVKVESGGGTIQTSDYYISNEFAKKRPFAILDIQVADNTTLSDKELRIEFTPRDVTWKYFLIFREPLGNGDKIDVGPAPSGLSFSEVTSFVGTSREEDLATKESLEARYPGSEVLLYESDTTVEFKQSPEKNIKLKKNNSPLINSLPSPSVQSPKAEAYILI